MTTTPHDALFKSVFQQSENAASELAHLLAPELVSAIDWSTLALEPGTYVDPKLAEKRSDLLFSAPLTPSAEPVLVYLLFEHRSSPEPKMALRLLGYMARIWERFINENDDAPLPLIIPAVLSHSPGGWTAPTRFSALFSPTLGPLADAVLPDFAYAVDIDRLAQLPNGERALEPLLRYIALVSSDLQLEQIRAILEHRVPIAEAVTMTIAEQLRAEGGAKGRTEGKAEAIILVLQSRGLHVDEQVQARLGSMSIEDLDASLRRAAIVASVDELLDG